MKEIRLQNGKVVHTHFRDYVSEYQSYWEVAWEKENEIEPEGRIAMRVNFAAYAEGIDTKGFWRSCSCFVWIFLFFAF